MEQKTLSYEKFFFWKDLCHMDGREDLEKVMTSKTNKTAFQMFKDSVVGDELQLKMS